MVNWRRQSDLVKYCLGNPNLVSEFFSHNAEKRCKKNHEVLEQKVGSLFNWWSRILFWTPWPICSIFGGKLNYGKPHYILCVYYDLTTPAGPTSISAKKWKTCITLTFFYQFGWNLVYSLYRWSNNLACEGAKSFSSPPYSPNGLTNFHSWGISGYLEGINMAPPRWFSNFNH